MFDESKHPRDKDGKFAVTHQDIMEDDDIDPLIKPLYMSYIDELNADPKRLQTKAKEEAETRRKILRDLAAACDTKLVEFAKEAIEGKRKPTEYYTVGKISDRQRKDIERLTGEKLDADVNTVSGMQIKHIVSRHGEEGKADRSMADMADIGLMEYVLDNYDTAELVKYKDKPSLSHAYLDKKGINAKQIKFEKSIGSKYIVVEAITDSPKSKDIKVVSMYIDSTKK